MDDHQASDEAMDPSVLPNAAPQSPSAHAIGIAHQVNLQAIEVVCEFACTGPHPTIPPFVLENRDHWCRLETAARQRAAEFSFVIVDMNFKDPRWTFPRIGVGSGIPPRLCEPLAMETVLFARQVAREDPRAAKILFGMIEPVAKAISSLNLNQARALAREHIPNLRVRWDDEPDFWRDILIACRTADEPSLRALRHRARLRFMGELTHRHCLTA